MDNDKIIAIIEALLFVSGEALAFEDIAAALSMTDLELHPVIQQMEEAFKGRGIQLVRINDKLQLGTSHECAGYIKAFFDPVQKHSLSQSSMETLSIIAYKQPVTRGDIDALRGVKCGYSVASLIEKGLVKESGHRDTLGKPALLITTDEFLRQFGIASLSALPSIDDLLLPDEALSEEQPLY